jgi:hypothetical protein
MGVPAGNYKLIVWQERVGWVVDEKSPSKGGGKPVAVAGATNVGTIPLKLTD